MNVIDFHNKYINEHGLKVCTDSRNVEPGSVFFALRGDSFNGNDFAVQALSNGCIAAVVDDPLIQHERCILVSDVLSFLTELARYHRRTVNIPVIGITGSNGKTTTKELICAALSKQKKVIATIGNLNNHIGVPLTLLRITSDTDIAVIEMGANKIGDIKELCEIAEPTAGIITNIGKAHLGYFGGIGGVIEAKTEMYRFLQERDGHIFVNASDDLLLKYAGELEKTLYGPKVHNEFRVISKETVPYVSVSWGYNQEIKTQLTGEYNVENIACAIAVAMYFNVRNDLIKEGIESYHPHNNRSEITETPFGNTIIKDFYNANSSSMNVAISNAAHIKKENQVLILILADMFELGEFSEEEHQIVARHAMSVQPDRLILIGKDFYKVPITAEKYLSTEDCIKALQDQIITNSLILIKGSNGMHLGKILQEVNL